MFENIIKKIESAEKIAIFTHTRPDGDALGSSFGFKSALSDMGKEAVVCLESIFVPTKEYKFISCEKNSGLTKEDCDLWIALDCASVDRLGEFSADFEAFSNTVAIDHHRTHVDFASVDYVDADSPATAEIICLLLKEMGHSMSLGTASDLYLGIMTDTGNFKYSSTTARTHRIAGELIELGVDFSTLVKEIFDTNTKEYFNLMKTALNKLMYFAEGKIAYLYLSMKDFENAGICEADADKITNLPNSISGVEVGVYVRERGCDEFKVSLRSNYSVDVSEIAVSFGGGGHLRASGFSLFGDEETVRETVVNKIIEHLR